jgi:RNA polymerase sigma-70 factor (ECF subfamily)
MVVSHANGQPAIAFYTYDDEQGAFMPFALNVLSFDRDGLISEIDAFIVRPNEDPDDEMQQSLPELPFDPDRLAAAYEPFGLPIRLD